MDKAQKKAERRRILDDKVYEAKLKDARDKRTVRHENAKDDATIVVRQTKLWIINHS